MKRPDRSAMFDAQVQRLIECGLPRATRRTRKELLSWLEPLRTAAARLDLPRASRGRIPWVLVVPAVAERALPLARPSRGRAFVDLRPSSSEAFVPMDGLPDRDAAPYLLVDVDTGDDLRNVTPEAALARMRRRCRSPLTIEEGVAVLLQWPDLLEERNAFSLLGSRAGDQRVPALWTSRIAGRVGPRLGWCWDRNPHTWLGSASCATRVHGRRADAGSRPPRPAIRTLRAASRATPARRPR